MAKIHFRPYTNKQIILFPDFVIAPPRIVFGAIAVRLKILALFYSPFPDGVSDENNP